jgi:hypothetical protein
MGTTLGGKAGKEIATTGSGHIAPAPPATRAEARGRCRSRRCSAARAAVSWSAERSEERATMQRLAVLAILGLTAAVTLRAASGCVDWADDCTLNATCCPDGTMSCFAHLDGGSDGEGGPSPSCTPSENVDAVADSCGVFVSSSMGNDTTGKGTQAAPYATLTKAINKAGSKPVYACGEGFAEALSITGAVTLFGALDCTKGWVYDASTKTQLTAGADMIPLSLASAASGTAVHDFAITSADASAMGGSSIAVLDSQANLALDNVDVVAGMGAPGAPGMPQTQVTTPATAQGSNGADDAACNMMSNILGGAGGTNTCNGMMTNGGSGGKGIPDVNGGQGGNGEPVMTPGNGGTGQSATASCDPGTKGTDGTVGMAGTGARGIGSVSAAGYTTPAGALGGAGDFGQGGGGGGGAMACDANNMFAGPSGGGGGAGGCGGAPGNPGQSGGSSIGILALGANLTLTNVTITAKGGGAGGLGGDGQRGQPAASRVPRLAPMRATAARVAKAVPVARAGAARVGTQSASRSTAARSPA